MRYRVDDRGLTAVLADGLLMDLAAAWDIPERAALDVTDPEPLPADHPLWTMPGLLLTPHIGGNSHGNLDRAYAFVADEIARYIAGEQPKNLVRDRY